MWVLLITELRLDFVISAMINRLSGVSAITLLSGKWFNFFYIF